jgi:hypothetical protein
MIECMNEKMGGGETNDRKEMTRINKSKKGWKNISLRFKGDVDYGVSPLLVRHYASFEVVLALQLFQINILVTVDISPNLR